MVNDQFYVISGFSTIPDPAVERFDPSTNTWTSRAPIPTPISQARAAALGAKIYVPGGFNNGFGGAISAMQIYDTATNTWSQGASLPAPRSGAGVAAFNGKIYIIAGSTAGSDANTVFEYDPVANTYATKAPVPMAAGNIGARELGGLIYAVGGAAIYLHYAYNPATDTWSTIADGPTPNFQTPGVFALNGELWVEGGTNGFSPYPANQQVQIYNPGANSWRFGPTFNTPRYGSSAAGVIAGRAYVAGGRDTSGTSLTSVESITGAVVCGTATVIPTVTATRTTAPTQTPTAVQPSATRTVAPPSATSTGTAVQPSATSTTATTAQPSATRTIAPPSVTGTVALPTGTATAAQATNTAVGPTSTSMAASPTGTPVAPTPCLLQFQDVPSSNTFYANVRCLACRGIIGGYPCGGPGESCGSTGNPYFRPNNDITRGQISKIVSESAGFNEGSGPQIYEDVAPGSTFYNWINRLSNRGLVGGYPCGNIPSEPCVGSNPRPYFRPQLNATRGQLSKIVSSAAGFSEPVSGQFYEDVTSTNPFYEWIMRLTNRGVMGGYPCGQVSGEPCGTGNRPYFRWANNVTRGQASKIVANTFFPSCQTIVTNDEGVVAP